MAEPTSSKPLSEMTAERRLDSWKEIASYLGRDVTTVQRWEKREGMPVHRHVHDKRGSVYAYGSELDVWLQSRGMLVEEEENEQGAKTPVDPESNHRSSRIPWARRWLALAGVALLALTSVTY